MNHPKVPQRAQILEVIDLCIKIQNANIATVFTNFYGHSNSLDISIIYGGWSEKNKADVKFTFYFGQVSTAIQLRDAIVQLKEILAKADVNEMDAKLLAEHERSEKYNTYLELKGEFEKPSVKNIAVADYNLW